MAPLQFGDQETAKIGCTYVLHSPPEIFPFSSSLSLTFNWIEALLTRGGKMGWNGR
jgi:hypothetical protein